MVVIEPHLAERLHSKLPWRAAYYDGVLMWPQRDRRLYSPTVKNALLSSKRHWTIDHDGAILKLLDVEDHEMKMYKKYAFIFLEDWYKSFADVQIEFACKRLEDPLVKTRCRTEDEVAYDKVMHDLEVKYGSFKTIFLV